MRYAICEGGWKGALHLLHNDGIQELMIPGGHRHVTKTRVT